MRCTSLLALALVVAPCASAAARDLDVTPSTLDAALSGLAPGDHVRLADGTYAHFTLRDAVGTAADPIVIEAAPGAAPVVRADDGPCCNTIQIDGNVSYVVLRGLTVDGHGVEGAFGLDARGPDVHHVTVEGCTFLGHDASQQTDAISTKTPTSGWVIRGNVVMGAGTGMYLGSSDGSDAFVGGLIEGNLFVDTIGYGVEIKWQAPHAAVPGSDGGPTHTLIRHNVFVKTDRASPDGDRPNLLVGGFPASGADAGDDYQIYGNVFAHNPRESLLQASGRVSIHDNVFFDVAGTAIRLVDHDLPLVRAWVYDNTIVAGGTGISFGNAASEASVVVGNVVLAPTPIGGPSGDTHDNLLGAPVDAAATFVAPGATLGAVDFHPLAGVGDAPAFDLATFASDVDHAVDFDCVPRGESTPQRGAYRTAGPGTGWRIALERKPIGAACGASPGPDAGVPVDAAVSGSDGGAIPRDASSTADAGATSTAGGCACRSARRGSLPGTVLLALSWVALVIARRARAR